MATTIHRPDVGYSGTQVHPPKISAEILLIWCTGTTTSTPTTTSPPTRFCRRATATCTSRLLPAPALHQLHPNQCPLQVRLVLERSGAFINAKGQLPHHFVDDKPVFQALSGATQTGPNVFWILSCFNYVKHSGNMTWLQACAHTAGVSTVLPLIRFHRYMPTLRHASSFLFDLIDPVIGLINAPGSLYIDVKHPATPCNFNPHLLSGVHPWQLHQRQ